MAGRLAIVSGFSGAGKGTVVKRLVEKYDGYSLSVSATTRSPRPGEVDGREYYFISREEFLKRIEEGDFLEHAEYVGNFYGTPMSFTKEKLAQGMDVILEIEAQGALQVREKMPEAQLIFFVSPSMEELLRRLHERGSESDEIIRKRISRAMEEAELALGYDRLLVNIDIEQSTDLLNDIIRHDAGIGPTDSDILEQLKAEGAELLRTLPGAPDEEA